MGQKWARVLVSLLIFHLLSLESSVIELAFRSLCSVAHMKAKVTVGRLHGRPVENSTSGLVFLFTLF